MNISSSPRSWIRAASLAFLAAGVALVVVGVTRYDLPGSVRPTQFAPAPRPLPAWPRVVTLGPPSTLWSFRPCA